MRALRKFISGVVMVVILLTLTPTTAFAYRHNFEYDFCNWNLKVSSSGGAYGKGYTRVKDNNGLCHYLTAYAKNYTPYEYHEVGPMNLEILYSDLQYNSIDVGKGRITTWEHEWTQTIGWVAP